MKRIVLIALVFSGALLVTSSDQSLASQSERFLGAHEVPPFVCDRIELVADLGAHGAQWQAWREPPRRSYGTVPSGTPVSICPRVEGLYWAPAA
jgi:hypothetical protein